MRIGLLVVVTIVLLAVGCQAWGSVKNQKPETEEDAHHHHMYHRGHRMGGKMPGAVPERELSHHEVLLQDLGDDSHVYQRSPHPKHHVGPRYSDSTRPSHRVKARFDKQGDIIPHELRDETVHSHH